ncbi:MAG: hypothetical protein WBG50_28690 [Desulfomonilaceae bacterium]
MTPQSKERDRTPHEILWERYWSEFMTAPLKFATWMSSYEYKDKKFGHIYRYHPRSDVHSIMLCHFIMEDFLERCQILREQALRDEVAYGINAQHSWGATQKIKTIDLAVGKPSEGLVGSMPNGISGIRKVSSFSEVFVSCEAKSVMTEHAKSQPRVYDELSSSHEIVHQGKPDAIAAGVAVVNIADRFVSPLRQITGEGLHYTNHKQPRAAERMVNHLRGFPIRDQIGEVGFDAYCTIVIGCDNIAAANLCETPPAPQPGDRDHYETFLERISLFYTQRFSSI